MNYLDSGQQQVYNLVSTMMDAVEYNMRLDLISKLGLLLQKDGNQFCYIYGSVPECYVAGFGDTPRDAMDNFWKDFNNQKLIAENERRKK